MDGRRRTSTRDDDGRRYRSVERRQSFHPSFPSGNHSTHVDGFGGSDLCMSKQYTIWIENIYRVCDLPPVAFFISRLFVHVRFLWIHLDFGRAAGRLFHFDVVIHLIGKDSGDAATEDDVEEGRRRRRRFFLAHAAPRSLNRDRGCCC